MAAQKTSSKRNRSPSPSEQLVFTTSSTIKDRDSTFIGLYSASSSPRALQSHPSIASATHRILAWRVAGTQRVLTSSSSQFVYTSGHDDDGEKYAGKKLENLLNKLSVQGAVVVARWYGGTLLGPVRFAHIEDVAKEAIFKTKIPGGLQETGRNNLNLPQSKMSEPAAKKIKSEPDDEDLREKLRQTLKQRDESIKALRAMLANKVTSKADEQSNEKKGEANIKPGISGATTSNEHIAQPAGDGAQKQRQEKPAADYTQMTLSVLRRLEAAKDATIGWILREIDKVENQGKETTNAEEGPAK